MTRKKLTWCTVHGDVKACGCKPDNVIIEAVRQWYQTIAAEYARREKRKAAK